MLQKIITNILGNTLSRTFTILIGIAETLMGIWVLSGYKQKLNAITQILIITTMKMLEYF